ncbi:voltage-dependent anion-selective channel-like [Bradysia coprophila]|uniref:voltage-dependent anion-selective channel-like n=1 Tax=Bradysia coprophila TaxID=38358 RepID=UPI00187D900C|nr:voltage-dependent anion-selective channel-like [Bradysia coprophila]
MAPPPSFSDLGRQARDVFSKGYNFGLWKLDCKLKTESGLQFSTGGHSNNDTGKVFGSLETKSKINDYGLTISEKWTTHNMLYTDITHTDKFIQGLKLIFEGSFSPQSGNKNGKVKASFSHDHFKTDTDMNINLAGPLITVSNVVGYGAWLFGSQHVFDCQKAKLFGTQCAIGYVGKEFVVHTNLSDGTEYSGSIFHKVSPSLSTGIQLSWSARNNTTKIGIAGKYNLDENITLRGKIHNNSLIGLGYQQKLHERITLTLSTLIDAKNFNAGGHKLGFALEVEA